VLAGAGALAACSEDPARPELAADALMRSAVVETPADHLVVFQSAAIPAGFAGKVAALGGKVKLAVAAGGVASVSGLDAAAVAALQQDAAVRFVEPETVLELPRVRKGPPVEAVDATPGSVLNPAGAFFFPRQWNLRAIHADQAWLAGALGSPAVTVAILDTGIGYLHADLAGHVDLARSVSFLPDEDALVAANFPGAHPVADLGYHGTHVAATVVSNGLAAAGVTSQTTLLGVKVCRGVGSGCPSSAIFAGIEHAVLNGADIINMSLGGAFQKRMYPGYIAVLNRLFNYAHAMGVTMVVSAGNESIDLDHATIPDENGVPSRYPSLYKTYCSTPNTICVSATGPTTQTATNGPWTNVDAPAYYTNFGRSAIVVAAPGGNIGTNATYVTAACSSFSLVIPICQTGTYVVGVMGTSMSAPHVSGLAAMVMGQRGHLSPSQVRAALTQSADDLGQRGTDPWYGKGRINAARAAGVN